MNISTPVFTFDQPLSYKVSGIIAEKKLDIVYRLGGFHTHLSFIGSIGYVMGGSGLEEVLTEVYAENSVLHMLSRKVYAKAVRGYILVDSALNNMLTEDVMPSLEPEHIANLKKAFQDFLKGCRVEKDCSEALAELAKQLDNKKKQLTNSNRTARLWIQFLEYIFFSSIWVFFHEHSRFKGQQGKGEAISVIPLYHFHPLHRHLDISWAITAES